MSTNATNGTLRQFPNPSDDDLMGEWVELALEAPHGDELGRMLRRTQTEELVWRRVRAAERHVNALANGGVA